MLKKAGILFCSLFLFLNCQQEKNTEINFKKNSFKKLLKQAQQEDKLIFIDAYTSWCAPCKWMDKNVFNKQEVAKFYNDNFINLKLDMEKGEGIDLAKTYQVNSFPTYLFIDSKGKVVHRANSRMSVQEFIDEGEKALNPSQSIGLLAEKYAQKRISQTELIVYAIALKKNRNSLYTTIIEDILATETKEVYTTRNGWKLVKNFLFEKPIFQEKLTEHQAYYIASFGQEEVNKLQRSIKQRALYQHSRNKDSVAFFNTLNQYKLLHATQRDLAIIHTGFYIDLDNAADYIKTSNSYIDALNNDPETIAFIARYASNYSDNHEILQQAAKLIRIAYEKKSPSYGTVSTFASIQNKIGNKKEAIKAAKLAVKMADTISSKIKKLAENNLQKIEGK